MRVPPWSVLVAILIGSHSVVAAANAQPLPAPAPKPTAAGGAAKPAPAKPASAKPAPRAPGEDTLSDQGELARIGSLVEGAKYEECAARLERLLDPASTRPLTDPDVIETALIYQSTCYLGLGKTELVDGPLRRAVRNNPQMRAPDSLVFPQRVVERFLKVREELYAELQANSQAAIDKARREAAEKQRRESEQLANMLALERLASQELVITKNRRWVGFVPFGVGQFQNDNTALGWTFFGVETALAATALTSLGVYSYLLAEVEQLRERGGIPAPEVSTRLHDWHLALTLSSYSLIGVAALGILEAQVSFVPEVRSVRERPLPAHLRRSASKLELLPELAASPEGFSVGLRGAF
jgi:hypothetical protein